MPRKAKRASQAAQIFAFSVTGVTAILLQVLRRSFGQVFSSDPLVVETFDRMVRKHLNSALEYELTALSLGLVSCDNGILRGHRRRRLWNSEGWRSSHYGFTHQSLQLLADWRASRSSRNVENTKDRRSLDRPLACPFFCI